MVSDVAPQEWWPPHRVVLRLAIHLRHWWFLRVPVPARFRLAGDGAIMLGQYQHVDFNADDFNSRSFGLSVEFSEWLCSGLLVFEACHQVMLPKTSAAWFVPSGLSGTRNLCGWWLWLDHDSSSERHWLWPRRCLWDQIPMPECRLFWRTSTMVMVWMDGKNQLYTCAACAGVFPKAYKSLPFIFLMMRMLARATTSMITRKTEWMSLWTPKFE